MLTLLIAQPSRQISLRSPLPLTPISFFPQRGSHCLYSGGLHALMQVAAATAKSNENERIVQKLSDKVDDRVLEYAHEG